MPRYSPDHVPRPTNAFLLFANSVRNKKGNSNSDQHQSQVSKDCAAMWHQLSDEQKAPYFEEARQIAVQHKIDNPDYVYRPKPKKKKTPKEKVGSKKAPKAPKDPKAPKAPKAKPSDWMAHSSVPMVPMHQFQSPSPYQFHNPMTSGPISHPSGFYNGYYPTGSTVQMNPMGFLPPNMPNNYYMPPPTHQVSYHHNHFHPYHHFSSSSYHHLQNRSHSTSSSTSSSGASTSSDPSDPLFDDFQSINPSIGQLSDQSWADYLNNF